MKEYPILFSGEMIKAILDNRKSQTRRVLIPQPIRPKGFFPIGFGDRWIWKGLISEDYKPFNAFIPFIRACPFGHPGDTLRLLCTWSVPKEFDKVKPTCLPHDVKIWHLFMGTEKPEWCGKLRSGRIMPKWMRPQMPTAENNGVRMERLQEITEEDCEKEGLEMLQGGIRIAFKNLWDSICSTRYGYRIDIETGKRYRFEKPSYPWESNPWVFVISFKRLNREALK